jgi:hypothetical protein
VYGAYWLSFLAGRLKKSIGKGVEGETTGVKMSLILIVKND